MSREIPEEAVKAWRDAFRKLLPFADIVSPNLSTKRLLRLSLFQVAVAIPLALFYGTLNRVMATELGVPKWEVALMMALPVLVAPLRAFIGHRSDYHNSAFGLKRVPFLWLGTMLQFGGFAVMPFALLILGDPANKLQIVGIVAAAASFLLVGVGMHTIQTAGLSLATDLSEPEKRPRVVAFLYITMVIATIVTALLLGEIFEFFSGEKFYKELLIQVIQGAAVATLILNVIALWKQEAVDSKRASVKITRPPLLQTWRDLVDSGYAGLLLVAFGIGWAGISLQDVLLEPYGADILGMPVAQTTRLTADFWFGSLVSYALGGFVLMRGANAFWVSSVGMLIGAFAYALVIFASVDNSIWTFVIGTWLIGFGSGLILIGTLTASMDMAAAAFAGLALGMWGAVQGISKGIADALSGVMYDVARLTSGEGITIMDHHLNSHVTGYSFVYFCAILLLILGAFMMLPLTKRKYAVDRRHAAAQHSLSQMD